MKRRSNKEIGHGIWIIRDSANSEKEMSFHSVAL